MGNDFPEVLGQSIIALQWNAKLIFLPTYSECCKNTLFHPIENFPDFPKLENVEKQNK